MKEDWTKHFARLAARHRSKAPDGLLEDVRKEMARRGLSVERPRKGTTVPMWGYRRTAAAVAAAALAIAVTFTWKTVQKHDDASMQTALNNVSAKAGGQASRQAETASASPDGSVPSPANYTYGSRLPASVPDEETAEPNCRPAEDNGETTNEENTRMAQNEQERMAQNEQTRLAQNGQTRMTQGKQAQQPRKQHRQTANYNDGHEAYETTINQRHGTSLTLGAFYGAGSSTGGTGGPGYGVMSDPIADNAIYAMVLAFDRQPIKTEAHHSMPIRAGVSVAWQLSPRWSVQTGVTYSYLSSDITDDYVNYSVGRKQRLHYLGLPLTASCNVVGNSHWTAYLTAGGMVEKLVKGQSKDNSGEVSRISERRLQWSVRAAAGAAFHVTPGVSIYAEPGVSHYFNNHSGVVNVYKDRPTAFTLDMGVRVSVGK